VTTFDVREYVVTFAPFAPLGVSHTLSAVIELPDVELIPVLASTVQLDIVLFVIVA
jgi:hypothetical protein